MTEHFGLGIGDRVVIEVSIYDSRPRVERGQIIADHGRCWKIKRDKYKTPTFFNKAFCYPLPKRSVVTKDGGLKCEQTPKGAGGTAIEALLEGHGEALESVNTH